MGGVFAVAAFTSYTPVLVFGLDAVWYEAGFTIFDFVYQLSLEWVQEHKLSYSDMVITQVVV